MAKLAASKDGDTPFSPERLLFFLCIVNLLNYVDRGTIASNGVNGAVVNTTCNPLETCQSSHGIQGEFGLSNFEDGVLSSVFMVGLLVASPIFAHLSKTHNPFKLMGVGLSVWTFATAMCGFSMDFWSITVARMLVGVGEASFISLAAPFIVDNAPQDKKTSWLSLFYMCIPVGMALGYVYGGVIGGMFTWRVAFWGEAVLMLPCAMMGFASAHIGLKADGLVDTNQNLEDQARSTANTKFCGNISRGLKAFITQLKLFWEDVKTLFHSRIYTINVAGSIAYNAVLGAYSYWGPRAGYAIFSLTNADMVFGGMTVICGIFGTVAGGLVLDKVGSTISNGFKLLTITTFVGAIACFLSFLSGTLSLFLPLFALGELFIFASQGPVNYLILQSATTDLRPLAMAVSTVCLHVFGDVPSSPLVGALQDKLNDWRLTTLILTSFFFVAAAIWSLGVLIPGVSQAKSEDVVMEATQVEAPLLAHDKC